MKKKKKTLKNLIINLEKELNRLGYTEGTMAFYKRQWKYLLKFANDRGEIYYSEQLGIDFIEKVFNILKKDIERELIQSDVQKLRVIRMIGDFQLHGTVLRRYYKHKELLQKKVLLKLSKISKFIVALKKITPQSPLNIIRISLQSF